VIHGLTVRRIADVSRRFNAISTTILRHRQTSSRAETEVQAGESYVLSISVVYDATEGGTQARQSAEKVASQLRELFDQAYGKPDAAIEIALDT